MEEKTNIGQQLQRAREKRDLSLQDVSHEIRIPHSTLSALEADDYTNFPDPSYAKSFLHQYSEFLKVDAFHALQLIDTGDVLEETAGIEYLNSQEATPVAPILAKMVLRPLLIAALAALLISGGIWGYFAAERHIEANRAPVFTPVVESDSEPSNPDASSSKALGVIPMTRAKRRAQAAAKQAPETNGTTPPSLASEGGNENEN